MTFSVLRNLSIKCFYGISHTLEALNQPIRPAIFRNLPTLSGNVGTNPQITLVRWKSKAPKKKTKTADSPDSTKVGDFYIVNRTFKTTARALNSSPDNFHKNVFQFAA